MKKLLSICLSLVMVLGLFPTMGFAADKTATPIASQVLVDGKNVAFDAYTIDGNNYFKLRDLAFAVNGSAKQFEVTWDGGKNAINLVPGQAYTVASGELAKGDGQAKNATLSTATTYINGTKAALTAYTINGNNYVKLRDLMQSMNVYIGWDGAQNLITFDTTKAYDNSAAPAPAPAPAPAGEAVTVPVTIVNETGVDIQALAMSPANNENWGDNLLNKPLKDGQSGLTQMTFTADTLVWDLLVEDAEKNQLNFMALDFGEVDVAGATLVLATEDGNYVAVFAQ